jgi:hypothetical protein
MKEHNMFDLLDTFPQMKFIFGVKGDWQFKKRGNDYAFEVFYGHGGTYTYFAGMTDGKVFRCYEDTHSGYRNIDELGGWNLDDMGYSLNLLSEERCTLYMPNGIHDYVYKHLLLAGYERNYVEAD